MTIRNTHPYKNNRSMPVQVIRPTAVALATCLLFGSIAQGQIIAAGVAGQTPVLGDKAKNGTPIVHIATPTWAGVSRNQYISFNVDGKGLIFNNSATPVSSVLAGGQQISGNSLLTTGPARIIVNQVAANAKSTLYGQMEVAGGSVSV